MTGNTDAAPSKRIHLAYQETTTLLCTDRRVYASCPAGDGYLYVEDLFETPGKLKPITCERCWEVFRALAIGSLAIPEPKANPAQPERAFFVESYNVAEWCPTSDGSGPATQVHVLFTLSGVEFPLVLRFKSPPELDRFIGALTRHRFGVWPKKGSA